MPRGRKLFTAWTLIHNNFLVIKHDIPSLPSLFDSHNSWVLALNTPCKHILVCCFFYSATAFSMIITNIAPSYSDIIITCFPYQASNHTQHSPFPIFCRFTQIPSLHRKIFFKALATFFSSLFRSLWHTSIWEMIQRFSFLCPWAKRLV